MLTSGMSISALPAFSDNYIWLLRRADRAAVVDPGDAAPVQAALAREHLRLDAILITHHHADHVGGLAALAGSGAPVYGPRAELARIGGITRPLDDGAQIEVLGLDFQVLAVPGHTLGHIAYWSSEAALLFCGDTLFSAGCGRLFEGSPQQMHTSLKRLAALPDDTAVYCTHEYTLSNLAFARAVEPDSADIASHIARVQALREHGQASLPSRMALERRINPFLRAGVPAVARAARAHAQATLDDEVAVFAELRRWKDGFKPSAPP